MDRRAEKNIEHNFFAWKREVRAPQGVICGASSAQEWLLPWWWERYREHNDFPVLFFDFGMSEEMKQWCQARAELISIPFDESWVASRSAIDPQLCQSWEKKCGWSFWNSRSTWFKKPFAFLSSHFKQTLWLDLDCEVLGSLKPLFSYNTSHSQLALVRDYWTDHLPQLDPKVVYNGGVVVFEHGSSLIQKWAEGAVFSNHQFWGDDHLLSHLICTHDLKVTEISEDYNWRLARGLNLNAVILHWVGHGGKNYIRLHGGIKPALDAFYQSCKGKI